MLSKLAENGMFFLDGLGFLLTQPNRILPYHVSVTTCQVGQKLEKHQGGK